MRRDRRRTHTCPKYMQYPFLLICKYHLCHCTCTCISIFPFSCSFLYSSFLPSSVPPSLPPSLLPSLLPLPSLPSLPPSPPLPSPLSLPQEQTQSMELQSRLHSSTVTQRTVVELQEMVDDLRAETELLKKANDKLMKRYNMYTYLLVQYTCIMLRPWQIMLEPSCIMLCQQFLDMQLLCFIYKPYYAHIMLSYVL